MSRLRRYTVSHEERTIWFIEVEAESPERAIGKAEQILEDGGYDALEAFSSDCSDWEAVEANGGPQL